MEPETTASQFRPLDPKRDWPFFDKDFAIQDAVRKRIFPLAREASEHLWRREVSHKPVERHLMRLPSSHWIDPDQVGPDWELEWNSDSGNEVQQFLQRQFPLPPDEVVYFMLMREHAYAVPIGVFAEYWRPFLGLDDEGPVLLHPASGYYACFGTNGYLRAGQREFHQAMAQISRSKASLRIMGDDLAPEEITRLLGCQPTHAQEKGEQLIGKNTGRVRAAKFGMWRLELAEREPEDIDGMVKELFSRAPATIEVWRGLADRFEVDLFCGLFMHYSNDGLSISPQTMTTLGARGIELMFDVYGPSEEDD